MFSDLSTVVYEVVQCSGTRMRFAEKPESRGVDMRKLKLKSKRNVKAKTKEQKGKAKVKAGDKEGSQAEAKSLG